MSATEPITLVYWKIKARNYAPIVIAQAGGLPLTLETEFDLAAEKPGLPFGQLPCIKQGGNVVVQSGAVIRYIARKTGLQGDTDADFGKSEYLIEEMQDITTLLKYCSLSLFLNIFPNY
jgi:hypothetical protein